MKVYVEVKKRWGEYKVGDKAWFDERKANPLIANGTLVKIKAPDPVPVTEKSEKLTLETQTGQTVETSALNTAVETAETTPENKFKGKSRKQKGQ
jgi:hypothetical protein